MKKLIKITSTCLPIETENIDTDQIVPARFLKIIARKGFGKYLFYDWRYEKNGNSRKDKKFDYSNLHASKILITGNNFGCGSSREHAVWAILDYGFQVVVSSSFGDIFYSNSLKNGLLPVILKPKELETLFKLIKKDSKVKILVDLTQQTVTCHAEFISASNHKNKTLKQVQGDNLIVFHFLIDSFRKTCLIRGTDELGYILSQDKKIKSFELKHKIYINYN